MKLYAYSLLNTPLTPLNPYCLPNTPLTSLDPCSLVITKFASRNVEEEFLIVGVAKDITVSQSMMNIQPPSGEILTYRMTTNQKMGFPMFEFMHRTVVEHPVGDKLG